MKKNHYLYFVYAIIAWLFFCINCQVPLMSDDILYSYIFPSNPIADTPWGIDPSHPVENFKDILISQYNHYFHHGGRTPVHILVQTFSSLWGKDLYNIISSIFFLCFIYIMGKVSIQDKECDKYSYFIPVVLLYPLMLHPKCFYNAMACGINYLWSSLICVLFWLMMQYKGRKSALSLLLILMLSFFAGWSHEGIVIPICVALFVFLAKGYRNLSKLQIVSGLIFYIGAALLILAPGNFERSGSIHFNIRSVLGFMQLLRVIYFYAFVVAISCFFCREQLFQHIRSQYALIIGLLVGFVAFSYLGPSAPRVGYGIDLLSAILLTNLISVLLQAKATNEVGKMAAMILIVILSVTFYFQIESSVQIKRVENIIRTSQDAVVVITEPQVTPDYAKKFVQQYSIDEAPDWIINIWGLKYNKKVIIRISE